MSLIIIVFIAILGWVSGMLVNYISDVLPMKHRLTAPFCLVCQAPLSLRQYLGLSRRCPSCGRHRHWRGWLVELTFIGIALWLWLVPQEHLGFILGLVVMVYFGVVVVIDIEHRLILHSVSLTGVALGLMSGTWLRAQYYGSLSDRVYPNLVMNDWLKGLGASVLGGVVGFGIMWILYTLGEWLVRALARRRGQPTDEVALGFGDVNLSGVLGLMLGWPVIVLGLFLAVFVGGLVSLFYLLVMVISRRYHLFMALPYGPYLVASAVVLLYLPTLVANWLK